MKKLYIGLFAAIMSAVSDILLLYHPDIIGKYDGYQFLFEIEGYKNTWGWILGMIFLPMLYLGYKGVKEIADEDSRKALDKSDWVVVFLISLGCVVHSSYHFLPLMHLKSTEVLQVEILTIKMIEMLFVCCYIMFCTIVTLQSLKKKNTLIFANRFFNPVLWMMFAFGLFFIAPLYGGYLAVSSFNGSIAFYFVGVILNKKRLPGVI